MTRKAAEPREPLHTSSQAGAQPVSGAEGAAAKSGAELGWLTSCLRSLPAQKRRVLPVEWGARAMGSSSSLELLLPDSAASQAGTAAG